MPRWEAPQRDTNLHPIIILLFVASVIFSVFTLILFINTLSFGTTILTIFAFSTLIFLTGRIYGELNKTKDFIEVNKGGIEYRATPPLTMGWLPKTEFIPFEEIESVDIAKLSPFNNPSETMMGIAIKFVDKYKMRIIGTNLSEKQIINVGLAMKGSVTLSKAMKKVLGDDISIGDTVDSIISKGKQLWDSFQNMQNKEE